MSTSITPKTWRAAAHLSMCAAAQRAGIFGKNPARTWQRWETGERAPPLHVVETLHDSTNGELNLRVWAETRRRYLALINAASTPLSDNTAHHVPGSSEHPIPEIDGLPRVDDLATADAPFSRKRASA